MDVAVGIFMRVGGPSVVIAKASENGPYPIVFNALTLNLSVLFGVKMLVYISVKVVLFPSELELITDQDVPLVPESHSN